MVCFKLNSLNTLILARVRNCVRANWLLNKQTSKQTNKPWLIGKTIVDNCLELETAEYALKDFEHFYERQKRTTCHEFNLHIAIILYDLENWQVCIGMLHLIPDLDECIRKNLCIYLCYNVFFFNDGTTQDYDVDDTFF